MNNVGSFYAISKSRVNHQLNRWNSLLPGVKPYYAVKCNSDPYLLEWLSKGEVGFDCASVREIESVKYVSPESEIIFANPCKKKDDILYASQSSVKTTVIDSFEEVDKLSGWSGNSLIRIRVPDSGSKMPFGQKFGADPKEVPELIAYSEKKGLQICGISFHVGSGCENPYQFYDAIVLAASLLPKIQKPIIDIGGGFTDDCFDKAAHQIMRSRGRIPSDTQLIAEPGRFFAASSHDLFVKVIGKKPGLGAGGFRYTLDESLYGQFSCIPFDYARPMWIRIRPEITYESNKVYRSYITSERRKAPAILYGRTCDSLDMIARSPMTEMLEEGDWLWFPHMGAYTTATSTEFNGFPKPHTLILDENTPQLPNPAFMEHEWPYNIEYVSGVKVPQLHQPL